MSKDKDTATSNSQEEQIEDIVQDLISDDGPSGEPPQEQISPEPSPELPPEQPTEQPLQEKDPDTIDPKQLEIQATQQIMIPDKKTVLKEDLLIKGILNGEGVFDLLDICLAELAEESASLKYERIKKELKDEDTDRISLRRANILKMVSDSLVQKRNLALNDFINLRSPQWQVVFNQLMSRIKQTFIDLRYSTEELELFFQKLQNNLEGFEETTELKLKESLFRTD